jgi:hypothetical protein
MTQPTKHNLRFFASTVSVAAPGCTRVGTKKKEVCCLFLYGDYSILAFSHIVISCCGLVYMVVSFEKSILFVLCFVNILLLIQVYDVLFQHLIMAPSLLLCFFFIMYV